MVQWKLLFLLLPYPLLSSSFLPSISPSSPSSKTPAPIYHQATFSLLSPNIVRFQSVCCRFSRRVTTILSPPIARLSQPPITALTSSSPPQATICKAPPSTVVILPFSSSSSSFVDRVQREQTEILTSSSFSSLPGNIAKMTSTTHNAGLDHAITVKVMFEGITRRTKMPLRDMVPRTLESNVC